MFLFHFFLHLINFLPLRSLALTSPSIFLSLNLCFNHAKRASIPSKKKCGNGYRSPCPDYREYSARRLRVPRRRGCIYTLESRPLYRSSLRIYNFSMDATNPLTSSSSKASSPNSISDMPNLQQSFDVIDSFAHS